VTINNSTNYSISCQGPAGPAAATRPIWVPGEVAGDMAPIPAVALTAQEKHLSGSWFGSGVPRRDYPRLLNLYRSHRLKLDELVTNTYSVDDAQQAFDDLKAGTNARGVIVFD